ncbi:hypothetical protein A0K93_11325 [Corynebacterium sp. BCW_4722]|nr:hypothetical protein A0K93_11325 [Corynebacterium sp. BCW_4722]
MKEKAVSSAPTSAPFGATHAPAEQASPDDVVRAALHAFAEGGYDGTRLDALAKGTGMSKRMIHYHFGDKKGLYVRALHLALSQLAPPEDIMNRSYAVPVEGMRRFADALFYAFMEHPDAVRLVIRENVDPVLEDEEAALLPGANDVTLHVERLLLAGQDAGAFRPGVSAADLLILTTSLCFFRVGSGVTALHVGRVDVEDTRNIEGIRRLVVDAVLAFLTSNIPSAGYDSYVQPASAPDPDDAVPQSDFSDVYGDGGRLV